MSNLTYDLIVLGSGPGGYVAAIRAAQLGLKTAIVEREALGGICLNWGCIPTKALLRSAEVYHYLQNAGDYGLKAAEITADIAAVVARSRKIAKQLSGGVTHLMKKNKISVYMGDGVLLAADRMRVTPVGKAGEAGKDITLTAPHIIIATGARARDLPMAKADGKYLWTYRHAMNPPTMPKKLLVIGSGAIGVEFASFYRDMGAEVTIVEMMERIVPIEDADVSIFLEKALTKQGMVIMTDAKVEALTLDDSNGAPPENSGVQAVITDQAGLSHRLEFSHAIAAIGIEPNSANIGLETLGVKRTNGHIDTDALCRTNVSGLWAIGDVTAPPWLAHKASHEAIIAVEAIAGGNPHPLNRRNIPGCTYCRPQVASVGYSEAAARAAGYDVSVGSFPAIGNGKALALGEGEGFVKSIFDSKSGELLGAHMVGAEVTELIHGFTIGKTAELVEEDFINSVFPHPTLSEMLHESVLAAQARAIHI